jgi:hypothetical protein
MMNKKFRTFINTSILSVCLLINSPYVFSQTNSEATVSAQKAECDKNKAAEWSTKYNRCLTKAQSKENRLAAQECDKNPDLAARESCHKALAEKLTGLSSDPNQIGANSTTNTSMLVNGVGAAYSALSFLNVFGKSKKESTCTSKKIYGVTSVGGFLSDFYIKYTTKKKADELKEKYKIDVKTSSQESQLRAFQYLRDEQEKIKEIASLEKKRNMILMLGYGAAAIMALYEMTPMGANAACTKPEKEEPPKDDKTAERKTETNGSNTDGIKEQEFDCTLPNPGIRGPKCKPK